MSHMVIYRGVDGKPGYHQTDDIHDAVSFVEQMRNEEGVEHARIFRLEEVVFEYRPYYRVELTPGAGGPAAIADGANGNGTAELPEGVAEETAGAEAEQEATEDESEPVDVVEVAEAADGDSAQNGEKAEAGAGKKGLFGR